MLLPTAKLFYLFLTKMQAKVNGEKGVRFDAKNLAVMAVMAALLIGAQFALSFVAGVELVTLLLCAFCVVFGVKRGVITAVAFSVLRCLIFGFTLNVVVLYLFYFPTLAVVVGFYGKLINKTFAVDKNPVKRVLNAKSVIVFIGLIAIVAAMTCLFTMVDNIVAPFIMGFSATSAKIYFINSLPVMLTHMISTTVSVALLFFHIYKAMKYIKESMRV